MKRRDYTFWLWALLLFSAFIIALGYYLPSSILGISIKEVDILADLRRSDDSLSMDDSSDFMIARAVKDKPLTAEDSLRILLTRRDSIYQQVRKEHEELVAKSTDTIANTQSQMDKTELTSAVYFEDYSSAHDGLQHFYKALSERKREGRPVRIAFLGDSFIEGDIFTIDVRRLLQKKYGGRGTGWMPFTSEVAGYRQGIRHTFSGWRDHFMLRQKEGKYTLSGHFYTASAVESSLTYALENGALPIEETTFYYQSPNMVRVQMNFPDTLLSLSLPPSDSLTAYPVRYTTQRMSLRFSQTEGALFYGIALDAAPTRGGIAVDNYSQRGNSGMTLSSLNEEVSRLFAQHRPYDMIVLQYGLNVASEKQQNYDHYCQAMKKGIEHIRRLFPSADIVLMGVSDRGSRKGGTIHSMAGVLALRKAQRKLAQECEIVFWDTFDAMGGEDSMARFVAQGCAAKDYTHMSFKGGRLLAERFVESCIFEAEYYNRI